MSEVAKKPVKITETIPVSYTHLDVYKRQLHPSAKHLSIQNPYVVYAADMTVLLTYHNLMDNWIDDKKVGSLAAAGVLKKKCGHIRERYPRQWNAMTEYLKKLHGYEKKNGESLDAAAGFTGELLGERCG